MRATGLFGATLIEDELAGEAVRDIGEAGRAPADGEDAPRRAMAGET